MIDSYPLEWKKSLKKVLAMDWERLIPGHPGQPGALLGTTEDVRNLLAFLEHASTEVRTAARAARFCEPRLTSTPRAPFRSSPPPPPRRYG
jgi:hypothetical protein